MPLEEIYPDYCLGYVDQAKVIGNTTDTTTLSGVANHTNDGGVRNYDNERQTL